MQPRSPAASPPSAFWIKTAAGRPSARPRSCSAIRISATTSCSTSTSTATTARAWARTTRRDGRGWSRSSSNRAESEMRVNQKICQDHARSSRLEWLESNGAGGFAMGTVAGANTRRYHGLLVASLRPPVDRHVLLSRLEEVVSDGSNETPLGTAQYPGTLHPAGYRNLIEFRLDPFPTWVYDVGAAHVEKQVLLAQGEDTVVVQYRATRRRSLRISPFLAFRDYHSLTHANPALDGSVREERTAGALVLRV